MLLKKSFKKKSASWEMKTNVYVAFTESDIKHYLLYAEKLCYIMSNAYLVDIESQR